MAWTIRRNILNGVIAGGTAIFAAIRAPRSSAAQLQAITAQLNDEITEHQYVEQEPRAPKLSFEQQITELRRVQSRLQAVLDHVIEGIISLEPNGAIESFNPGAEQLLGYTAAEVIGRKVNVLMPEPYYSDYDHYLTDYPPDDLPRVVGTIRSVELRRKDGSLVPVELSTNEIHHEDEHLFVTIVRDLTERKRIEQMRKEFVSIVSHELRTPLTSIRGSLGLIAGGIAGELPEQAKQLITIAYNNSERLGLLINDILDIEKIESGKMRFALKPQALQPLIEAALEANQAYAEQYGVHYRLEDIHSETQYAKVNVDTDRLLQVMANLLSNAAKFSPLGAPVDISVTSGEHWARVTVADHGPGIADEFRDRIFQKFSQADSSDTRQKGGSGLGLSISKALVEKMGGRIGFDTEPGTGTRFYFELPIWHDLEFTALPAGCNNAGRGRILICEDDYDIGALIGLLLKRRGFTCDIVGDAEEARQRLAQPHYDAIIVDLMLPGESGITLIRSLRTAPATRELPIVVVSGLAQAGCEALAGSGFAVLDWLDKPIDQQRLIAAVEQATRSEMTGKPKILHVEDDPDLQRVIGLLLADAAEVVAVMDFRSAEQAMARQRFDLVILDIVLPDGSGLNLLPLLNRQVPPVPVIVFSSQEPDPEHLHEVAEVLVKTRTSNDELLETITALVQRDKERSWGSADNVTVDNGAPLENEKACMTTLAPGKEYQ
jgi:PAS domain S-box-containing protein